jgi:outer membrane protein assembly factor BamB
MESASIRPVVADHSVYFVKGSSLYRLDKHDGQIVWTFDARDEITAVPQIGQESVFLRTKDRLYRLSKHTGEILWLA